MTFLLAFVFFFLVLALCFEITVRSPEDYADDWDDDDAA